MIKRFNMHLNLEVEEDKNIYNHLNSKRNKSTYVRNLIINDMNANKDNSISIKKVEKEEENIDINGLGNF